MPLRRHRFAIAFLAALGASAFIAARPVAATVVDTFDNNVNLGTWKLTTNPNMLYQIEPSGGDPGAYLHGQVSTAVPTWFVSNSAGNPFLGDYVAKGVTSFSCDMTIAGGVQVPDRNVTLHFVTTLGTGQLSQGVEAYYVGTNISTFPIGWHDYSYAVDAASSVIPAGWVVTKGNGGPGTAADWHNLMTHVENVNIALGTPGFFYPNLNVWNLGFDNVTLTTVPAPGAGAILLALGAAAPKRRRRST